MPTNSSRQTAKPRGTRSGPRFKFLVLWRPPNILVVAGLVSILFAVGGIAAVRYSNAQISDQPDQAAGSQSDVLWQDQPQAAVGATIVHEGRLQNWRSTPQFMYGGATVQVITDQAKSRAIQFYAPAKSAAQKSSQQRAEQVPDLELQPGKTYWFGYDLSVSGEQNISRGFQSIWQLANGSDTQLSSLWLSLNTGQAGLGLESDAGRRDLGPAPYGNWTRLLFGVSSDESGRSSVEVWRDGQNVAPRQNLPGPIATDGQPVSPRFGIYRSAESWPLDVRMANLKIGTSRQAVQ